MLMNRFSKLALAAALVGASASASAWWGGPFSSWGDDFFGDGWGDFSLNVSGGGHGWGRGYNRYYDYYGPYWGGYGPYGYGAPFAPYGFAPAVPALTEEQRAAATEQQKAFAEQQAQMLQQAVEAQRKFAEQFAAQQTKLAQQWQERAHDDGSVRKARSPVKRPLLDAGAVLAAGPGVRKAGDGRVERLR